MSGRLILAIDQGTTNSKAVVVDETGAVVAEASARVPLAFPQPGWVESDARDLWRTVEAAISGCLEHVDRAAIGGVAVANQRESVLAWDRRSGEPLGPCISWQCHRTAAFCEALRARGLEPLIQERTGLGIDPMFSASKAAWLLDHVDDGRERAARGEVCVGTVDSWLLWNLSGGTAFATDLTNAARTQLLDLDRLRWDDELLALFDVPRAALPELRGSSALHGRTGGSGALPEGLPIAALVGDSHGAMFGHGAPGPGSVKATYGTGTSVMAPVGEPLRSSSLSSTVAWSVEPAERGRAEAVYAIEGNIYSTGATIEWLAGILALPGRERELEALASSVDDAEGVYLVPAFTGLGAPHWDAEARGTITGLTRGSRPAHLARAAFESVGFQVKDVLDEVRASVPTALETLYADGGAVQSDLLAQMQADLLDLPVLRTRSASLAALGAAYLAGLALGTWGSMAEVRDLPRGFDRFEPRPGEGERARERHEGWQAALRRAAGSLDAPALAARSC
jgi:glycerol kinase